jgi:hypothetical protein
VLSLVERRLKHSQNVFETSVKDRVVVVVDGYGEEILYGVITKVFTQRHLCDSGVSEHEASIPQLITTMMTLFTVSRLVAKNTTVLTTSFLHRLVNSEFSYSTYSIYRLVNFHFLNPLCPQGQARVCQGRNHRVEDLHIWVESLVCLFQRTTWSHSQRL